MSNPLKLVYYSLAYSIGVLLWPNGYSIWLRTVRLGFNPWSGQKSLTPGFALMNHLYEMIISVRIDCCAET